MEKAHHDVLNMFYQVFDRGFMRDGEGREIDFKNTVILMTSNIGSEEIAALCNKTISEMIEDLENLQQSANPINSATPTYGYISLAVKDSLKNHFPPALIGRMQTIAYQPLDKDTLQGILALQLENVARRLHDTHGIEFRCDKQALEYLANQCDASTTGARTINAMLEQRLLPEISRNLLGFMVDDDLPDILTLSLNEEQGLSCVFSDKLDNGQMSESLTSPPSVSDSESSPVSTPASS